MIELPYKEMGAPLFEAIGGVRSFDHSARAIGMFDVILFHPVTSGAHADLARTVRGHFQRQRKAACQRD